VALAPYEAVVLAMGQDPQITSLSEQLADQLREAGVETVLDDRDERPGVKFNDADLIGYPLQIVVGKKAGEGVVELKVRHTGEKLELAAAGLPAVVAQAMAKGRAGQPLTAALLN
jgi:prolyl-tRNA synthetase